MKIQQYITTLLFRHDCVIIPGLGGFVANHQPARLQKELEIAFPPSKVIIFNKHLLTNDGLLAETIAREENLSFAEAGNKISEFVVQAKSKMQSGERLVFDGLGSLFFDEDRNIQFQADYSQNFLMEAFGLHPVVAREIVPEKEALTEVLSEESKEAKIISINPAEEPEKQKSFARRYWPVAAALVPLVFYSVWIPTQTEFLETGRIEFADLNPFHRAASPYHIREQQPVFSFERNADEWQELVANAGGPVARLPLNDQGSYLNVSVTIENPEAESTRVARKNFSNKTEYHHHIIGGCFRELTNAEKLVAELKSKGHDAYILDEKGGLHRVAIDSFESKSEAVTALGKIRGEGIQSAWLLER